MKISSRLENAFLLSVIAAITGGSVAVAAKIALEVFQPFTLVFIRFFSATLLLIPLIIHARGLSFSSVKKFFTIGVVGALNPILLFIALQYTKASVSPLIYAGVPAMTALYTYLVRGQKIDKRHILGIGIGFFGVALIILLPLVEKGVDLSAFTGNILIFFAAIAFMFYGIMSKSYQSKFKSSPVTLTFYFCLVSLMLSLPFVINEARDGFLAAVQLKHVLAGIYTGVIGTVVFYLVYQQALKLGSELAAALFTYLQPIATILLASAFLDEKITVPFVIGGVLAVIGARLASNSKPTEIIKLKSG